MSRQGRRGRWADDFRGSLRGAWPTVAALVAVVLLLAGSVAGAALHGWGLM